MYSTPVLHNRTIVTASSGNEKRMIPKERICQVNKLKTKRMIREFSRTKVKHEISDYDWLTEIPLAWIIFKWSTVSCRISAFSNLAEPCFSYAVGTRRLSSVRLVLIRSRRLFSIMPRRFFRVSMCGVSEPSPGEEQLKKFALMSKNRSAYFFKIREIRSYPIRSKYIGTYIL